MQNDSIYGREVVLDSAAVFAICKYHKNEGKKMEKIKITDGVNDDDEWSKINRSEFD